MCACIDYNLIKLINNVNQNTYIKKKIDLRKQIYVHKIKHIICIK